jgi:Fe-S-cluster-containing hydrogenase component 2
LLLATKDELCSGCRTCQVACSLTLFGVVNPKKAALSVRGRFPAPGSYHLYTCNQCGECAAVCPVEAIAERDGVFIIDPATCTNCGLCVESCPRSAMFTHPALPHPIKCTACGECVRYCPRGAVYDAHGEVSRK